MPGFRSVLSSDSLSLGRRLLGCGSRAGRRFGDGSAALAAIDQSESVLAATAGQTGLPLHRLRASLSATPVRSGTVPGAFFFQVSVAGRRRISTLAASRLIGSALLERIEAYRVAQTA